VDLETTVGGGLDAVRETKAGERARLDGIWACWLGGGDQDAGLTHAAREPKTDRPWLLHGRN
jgi:hypothetical protein